MAQQICILKVNIQCCNGCQKTAKRKLQKIPGVNSIFYDSEDGFMMVAGDMDPMELVDQFTKWGKKAELVSVQTGSALQDIKNSPEISPMTAGSSSCHGINVQDNKTCQSPILDHKSITNDASVKNPEEKKKRRRKCFLLSLFDKNKEKPKVEPLQERQLPPIRPDNTRVLPTPNAPPMHLQHSPPFCGAIPPLQPPPPPQYGSVFSHMGPPLSSLYGGSRIFQPSPALPPQTSPTIHFSSRLDNHPW